MIEVMAYRISLSRVGKSSIVRNVSRKIGIVNSRIMSGRPAGVYKVLAGVVREKKCVKS